MLVGKGAQKGDKVVSIKRFGYILGAKDIRGKRSMGRGLMTKAWTLDIWVLMNINSQINLLQKLLSYPTTCPLQNQGKS